MPKINIIPIKLKAKYRSKAINELITHAQKTLSSEPECLKFEIIQDSSDINKVWLYEVYKNTKALYEHNNTEYMDKRNQSDIWSWRDTTHKPCIGYNIWPTNKEY